LAHQNRNRDVLQEIQRSLTPEVKQQPRRTRIIDHTNEIRHTPEYKELASFGGQAGVFDSACHGCIISKWCSACVRVGWIVTPKQCKEAREIAAQKILQLTLRNVEFKVKEDK